MKKYFSLFIAVLGFGFSPLLCAQNLPKQVAKGLLKSGSEQTASQLGSQALREAIAGQVAKEVYINAGVGLPAEAATVTGKELVSAPLSPIRIGGVAVPKLPDFSAKDLRFFQQAKIFLNKRERFAGDPATHVALERLRAADGVEQLEEIAKLDIVYPKLKTLSTNGMFAKFKYVGPEPSGVALIKATDFTLMLEGPVKMPLIEETLYNYPKAVVEKQHVGNLSAQVLFVRSGRAEELKEVVEDIVMNMQQRKLELRLGVHEVNDFVRTGKVHLHFEGFNQKGVFYNYILFVDFANIKLPYNPITFEQDLTVLKALRELDNVATHGYGRLAETQAMIFATVTDILPMEEGSEAYERLLQALMQ